MYFILGIILIILVVGVLTILGIKFGIDFWIGRSNNWGSSHMEDLGIEPEKRHKDDWPF